MNAVSIYKHFGIPKNLTTFWCIHYLFYKAEVSHLFQSEPEHLPLWGLTQHIVVGERIDGLAVPHQQKAVKEVCHKK